MKRRIAVRVVMVALAVALSLVHTACTGSVGVGVSVPIFGGWGGPYGGVSVGVGIPIR